MGRKRGEQRAFPWAAPSGFFPSAGRGRERCLDLARDVGAGAVTAQWRVQARVPRGGGVPGVRSARREGLTRTLSNSRTVAPSAQVCLPQLEACVGGQGP